MPQSGPKQTKEQRREAARQQAIKIREAQKRRERRNRFLLIGGIVAFVAVVGIAVYLIIASSMRSPGDVDPNPTISLSDGAIPVGSGGAGTENEGAAEIQVYLDFQCPWCAVFEEVNAADLNTLVADGDATVKYYTVNILDSSGNDTGFSTRSANAAATIAEQAPESYVSFMTELFAQQSASETPLSDEQIADVALAVGVPQEVIDAFADREYVEWVNAVTRQFSNEGHQGTPAIVVDGEVFTGWNEPGALATLVTGEAPAEDATTGEESTDEDATTGEESTDEGSNEEESVAP